MTTTPGITTLKSLLIRGGAKATGLGTGAFQLTGDQTVAGSVLAQPTVTTTGTTYGGFVANGVQAVANPSGAFLGNSCTVSYNVNAATLQALYGEYVAPTNTGSGTISSFIGLAAIPTNSGSGTVPLMYGVIAQPKNLGTGTVTTAYGLYADMMFNNAGGTVTNTVGLYLDYEPNNVNPISNRWGIRQLDPGAANAFYSPVFGPYGANLNSLTAAMELAPAAHPGVKSGRYYFGASATAVTPVALSANTLYFVPFLNPSRNTWTEIGSRVTTAVAATNLQFAIYKAGGGVPTTKVVSTSSVSSATTGAKTSVISQQLETGYYFLAVASDGAPTINWLIDQTMGRLGWSTDNGTETIMFSAGTFGTWPDNPTIAYTTNASNVAPQVWLRF